MVPYVYRRPYDHRAPSTTRHLLFPPQTSQVSTYRGPIRLVYSGGVFRQGYSVVPPEPRFQPASDSFGANSSLTFTASGTLTGSTDPTAVILAFQPISIQRSRWYRERFDDTPIRSFNPIFTSWAPTGEALLQFSCSGTMLAIVAGDMAGSATLTFSATANTDGVSLISGQTTLTFSASAVIPSTGSLVGSTSLTFSVPDVNVPTLRGSTSLSFSAGAIAVRYIKRITMVISHPRIEMEIL